MVATMQLATIEVVAVAGGHASAGDYACRGAFLARLASDHIGVGPAAARGVRVGKPSSAAGGIELFASVGEGARLSCKGLKGRRPAHVWLCVGCVLRRMCSASICAAPPHRVLPMGCVEWRGGASTSTQAPAMCATP